MPTFRIPIVERLFTQVDMNGPVPEHCPKLGPCWLWTGSLFAAGYGRIASGGYGDPMTTHRASWEVAYGPVPDGLYVLHRCDVRNCIRPTHLFVGTQADNMADMKAKGRSTAGRSLHRKADVIVKRY